MSDEYEDAGGAEAPFEDPVSMSSRQWFGEPGSGPDLSPEESIAERASRAGGRRVSSLRSVTRRHPVSGRTGSAAPSRG